MDEESLPTRQTTPINVSSRRRNRTWSDAPLRTKLVLLVMLAIVAGCLVGMIETYLGCLVWPLSCGLSLVVVCLWWQGNAWVWRPIDQLLRRVESLSSMRQTTALSNLPLDRRDEVGQLPRAMHARIVVALRDHHEAS